MDTQYCFNATEFHKLAGSGGGKFTGPGLYHYDTDKNAWRLRLVTRVERQQRAALYLRVKHATVRRFQLCVKYKDDTHGVFTYEGKAAAEHIARDLFYCLHDRRDVRNLLLTDERTAEDIYQWFDGEMPL